MELSDLPARELARLDAICLEFESRLRESLHGGHGCQQVTDEIDILVENYGGDHTVLLRHELDAITQEVQREQEAKVRRSQSRQVRSHQSTVPLVAGDEPTHAALTHVLDRVPDSTKETIPLPTMGDRIGPYIITSVLGRGGMGIVYRATDTRLERSVAIKMLSVHGRQSQSLIERFQREAKAVAGLTHPHIVELFDIGVFDGMPYVVMEHLRGETLLQRIRTERIADDPISTEQVRNWGIQLADALVTAHGQGVIHRDIKPENVMVMDRPRSQRAGDRDKRSVSESDSSLKLFDFGLSRVGSSRFENETEQSSESSVDLAELLSDGDSSTRFGMILGTPGYMAPEQARGGVITPAADIFSLGCVLYEAMCFQPAFSGETATQRFAAVLEKQPSVDPLALRDDPALSDLILAMLAKEPASRPVAADVLATLQAGVSPTGTSGSTKSDSVVISRRRLIEMVGGAVAGGAIGATFLPPLHGDELRSIRSIAVLRFQPGGAHEGTDENRQLVDRQLDQADLLSGMLANELSRLKGITVPKYDSITAAEPQEFREVAKRLEVDALISGTFTTTPLAPEWGETDESEKLAVNVEIVSGTTGKLINGFVVSAGAGDNLIEQAGLAQKIAEEVGFELALRDERSNPADPDAFTCLIKGRTQSNPDTVKAMETALACFEHAVSVDDTYPDGQGGVALTAISLAARVNDQRASELIARSQKATERALALAPDNLDALLAQAMLDYQVLADFDRAAYILAALTRKELNQWQVYQQAAWLSMISSQHTQALDFMRRAVNLHPTSLFVKSEWARAEWFRNNTLRASDAAADLLALAKIAKEDDMVARGLLIDIYEQADDHPAAARLDAKLNWKPTQSAAAYYTARQQRIGELPYGPFGPTLNAAIVQLRHPQPDSDESHEQILSRLISAQLPMLPLVLCTHHATKPLRQLEQALETYSVLRFT